MTTTGCKYLDWIILVSEIHNTGRLYNFFKEGKTLEFLKIYWILEDFTAWSYLVYFSLY